MQLGHAHVQIEVCHFLRYPTNSGGNGESGGAGSVHLMINLQRPDPIFEDCIANGMVPSQPYFPNAAYSQNPSIVVPFYPRVVLASDPRLLPGEANANKTYHVGKLRFEICEQGVGGAGADVFSPIGPADVVGTSPRRMEAMIDIDTYINKEEAYTCSNSLFSLFFLPLSIQLLGIIMNFINTNNTTIEINLKTRSSFSPYFIYETCTRCRYT